MSLLVKKILSSLCIKGNTIWVYLSSTLGILVNTTEKQKVEKCGQRQNTEQTSYREITTSSVTPMNSRHADSQTKVVKKRESAI